MVLFGTLYPLAMEALSGNKMSVGPPYFDGMFVPLTVPLAVLVGMGAMSRWKRDELGRFKVVAAAVAGASLLLAALWTTVLSSGGFSLTGFFGLGLALWVLAWSIYGLLERLRYQSDWKQGVRNIPAAIWGMTVAHIGIAVFVLGVSHVNAYSLEKDIRMNPGETYQLGNYEFRFDGVSRISEANYIADQGSFTVQRKNRNVTLLQPQKRFYTSGNPMTEAAIDTNLARDLYVSLGEPLGQGAWSVRLYKKAFVACIWLGGFLMALGGLIATADRRFRRPRRKKNDAEDGKAEAA